MPTTNIKSSSNPWMYIRQRGECEKLLEIAKKLEKKASNNPEDFPQDQESLELKEAWKNQYACLNSFAIL
jgi:hypothetical protein